MKRIISTHTSYLISTHKKTSTKKSPNVSQMNYHLKFIFFSDAIGISDAIDYVIFFQPLLLEEKKIEIEIERFGNIN